MPVVQGSLSEGMIIFKTEIGRFSMNELACKYYVCDQDTRIYLQNISAFLLRLFLRILASENLW
jgi:hypothetical protein